VRLFIKTRIDLSYYPVIEGCRCWWNAGFTTWAGL